MVSTVLSSRLARVATRTGRKASGPQPAWASRSSSKTRRRLRPRSRATRSTSSRDRDDRPAKSTSTARRFAASAHSASVYWISLTRRAGWLARQIRWKSKCGRARGDDLAGIVSQQHGVSAKRAFDPPARPGMLDFDTRRYPMFHRKSPDEIAPRRGDRFGPNPPDRFAWRAAPARMMGTLKPYRLLGGPRPRRRRRPPRSPAGPIVIDAKSAVCDASISRARASSRPAISVLAMAARVRIGRFGSLADNSGTKASRSCSPGASAKHLAHASHRLVRCP